MTERPIIFSAPMVKALLDGRKTMTRRLAWRASKNFDNLGALPKKSPWQRVKAGDRLWVREAFGGPILDATGERILYRATDESWRDHNGRPCRSWRPSIYMPRWASRLTLTMIAAKIERLQDISEDDALCEGVEALSGQFMGCYRIGDSLSGTTAKECFARLWNDLHGARAWATNPPLVALTFTVAKRNIDAKEAA